jgi:hypothetical protein
MKTIKNVSETGLRLCSQVKSILTWTQSIDLATISGQLTLLLLLLLLLLSRVVVTIDGIMEWMIEFIATYTFTTRDYRQYSAIADLHTLQFTVPHALGFSDFTSRILATDL